jgi:dTDP-4-amino-4,6-dideoxygalactose transaminase
MKVPYFDLKAQYLSLRDEVLAALDETCKRASFILGEDVASFEREFAAFCEVDHCVALNSGTSALHLALVGAGVTSGDEVITTANTFIATLEAISYTGARPVLVDIDPVTGNIDPDLVEDAITPRCRAIIPVHLYGRPADLDALDEIARRRGLALIEDACQAHGARFQGRRIGGFGLAAAFSFYPGKNLGAYGEGGALTTNDGSLAELARSLRSHGESRRYYHDHVGFNYRMDGFQGAVLRVKLRHLEAWTERRRAIARLYRHLLQDARIDLPQDDPRGECVYHLFTAWVDERDQVRAALEARGVQTAIHYPRPVHLQDAYAWLGHGPGSFPHTERACERVLSLPFFPEMSDAQVEAAALALRDVVGATYSVEPTSRSR